MDRKLQDKLTAMLPYAFKYKGCDNPKASCLAWGFSCGNGWYNIIKEIIQVIKKYDKDKSVRVIQVKEKFGGLRFYYHGGPLELYNKIDVIANKSYTTCEECGKPGVLYKEGWWHTLCKKCKTTHNKAAAALDAEQKKWNKIRKLL